MSRKSVGSDVALHYSRIPITAEKPPDFSDFSELIDVVMGANITSTPIVVNCQLGRGRSTLTSIILVLIQQWLESNKPSQRPSLANMTHPTMESVVLDRPVRRQSYVIINSSLFHDFTNTLWRATDSPYYRFVACHSQRSGGEKHR